MLNNFVFYRSFAEAAKTLDDESRLALYDAIIEYALDGEELECDGVASGMFALIKPAIDSSNKKRAKGALGGAPVGNQNATKQPKNNLETTKKQPKNNLETTKKQPKTSDKGLRIKDKGQGIEEYKELSPKEDTSVSSNLSIREVNFSTLGDSLSGKPDDPPPSEDVKEIIGYFNTAMGTKYSPNTYETKHALNARLKDYSVEEIKTVIDRKIEDWGNDPKMAKYLRPSTLFRQSNFESYINERQPFDANDYMLGIINGGDP